MSFKLICGPTGSGKTTRAIEAFLAALAAGQNPIFVAPSQPDAAHFLRHILRAAPGNVISGGRVTTFRGLCDEAMAGAPEPRRPLSANQRRLLMRSVIASIRDLNFLKLSSRHDGFTDAAIDIIAELEEAGVDPQQLASAGTHILSRGLNMDLLWIYRDYLNALEESRVCDAQQWQSLAIERVGQQDSFPGRGAVVVDGFHDFTPQQRRMLDVLRSRVEILLVTLPYVSDVPGLEYAGAGFPDLFDWTEAELLTQTLRKRDPALQHIDRHLFNDGAPKAADSPALGLVRGSGARGEAELVGARILALFRDGTDLDDIAVVYRSLSQGASTLACVLEDYGVPYELQGSLALIDTAAGRLAHSALAYISCADAYSSALKASVPLPDPGPRECLLRLLLNPFGPGRAGAVEGFVREAALRGTEDPAELASLWRELGLGELPFVAILKAAASAGIRELGRVLCSLVLTAVSGDSHDGDGHYCAGRDGEAMRHQRHLDSDLAALKAIAEICAEAELLEAGSPRSGNGGGNDAVELLRSSIERAAIDLPAASSRGCVRILDPHRILNQQFKVVFVCGLLENVFPARGRQDPFVKQGERKRLQQEHGIELDTGEDRIARERFLFHRTLSRATEAVYLCYPYCDEAGSDNVVSLFVDDVLMLFDVDEPGNLFERLISDVVFSADVAPTRSEALRSLCLMSAEGRRHNSPSSGSTAKAASSSAAAKAAAGAGMDGDLRRCLGARRRRTVDLREPAVLEELGARTSFYATDLERFAECRFKFFVNALLEPALMKSDTLALDRGNIAHAVLADFGFWLKGVLAAAESEGAPPRPMAAELLGMSRHQLDSILAERTAHLGNDLDGMLMKSSLHYYLHRFIDYESQYSTALKPQLFEASFGHEEKDDGWQRRSCEINLGDGLSVRGRIDRVDISGEYAAVLDYKMSKKVITALKLRDEGKIQIPLYMRAIRDIWGLKPIGGQYVSLMAPDDKIMRGPWKDGFQPIIGGIPTFPKDFYSEADFDALLEEAKVWARELADGIRSGDFSPAPLSPETCKYCDLNPICHFGDESS